MTYVNDQPKRPAPDVWDDSVAPGGYVCGVCGVPTEDEACAAHQERGTWWEVAQFRPPPDTRPPVEQTQLPPGSRPVQIEPTAYQRDIAAILTALGLSDHARDYSPHEVVQRDILPAIARLREPTREHFRTWPRDIPPSASSY